MSDDNIKSKIEGLGDKIASAFKDITEDDEREDSLYDEEYTPATDEETDFSDEKQADYIGRDEDFGSARSTLPGVEAPTEEDLEEFDRDEAQAREAASDDLDAENSNTQGI